MALLLKLMSPEARRVTDAIVSVDCYFVFSIVLMLKVMLPAFMPILWDEKLHQPLLVWTTNCWVAFKIKSKPASVGS